MRRRCWDRESREIRGNALDDTSEAEGLEEVKVETSEVDETSSVEVFGGSRDRVIMAAERDLAVFADVQRASDGDKVKNVNGGAIESNWHIGTTTQQSIQNSEWSVIGIGGILTGFLGLRATAYLSSFVLVRTRVGIGNLIAGAGCGSSLLNHVNAWGSNSEGREGEHASDGELHDEVCVGSGFE